MLRGQRVEYTLERKRVKNVNLRVKPEGLFVSAPPSVPAAKVDEFLVRNADSILRMAQRQSSRVNVSPAAMELTDGGRVPLLGRAVPLRVLQGTKNSVTLADGVLVVTVKDPADGELCRRVTEKWLREECIALVTARCRALYALFPAERVPWPELKFRLMRSRWGSCQPREGIVTFNTALISVPPECIDYVVVHELCHFFHADHSPAFWAEVEKRLPDHRARRKALRQYGL